MNHYQTLGLLQSAESAVIKAAYRALANIYHPDKNSDPKASAAMQNINIAYAILSDAKKRSDYDSSLIFFDNKVDASDFESKSPYKEDPLSEKWEIALRFNPVIDRYCKHLEKLSWVLGFSYKIQVLEGQDFKNANKIYQDLRFEYLSKFFGKATDVMNYAEEFILANKIDAAVYLNKIIVVMGANVTLDQLASEMKKQYPESVSAINEVRLYTRIANVDGYGFSLLDSDLAIKLVEINGGSVDSKFLGKFETIIGGNKICHRNRDEFCNYVLSLYHKKYT